MIVTLKRAPFVKILSKVADGIPAKTADPNYLSFLLTITDEEKTILASDGDTTIYADLSEDKELIVSYEPGVVEIPAHYLTDIVRQLEGEEVTLNQADTRYLNITDGKSNFNISCIDGKEYPLINKNLQVSKTCTLESKDFTNLFDATAFATATKGATSQYYGVYVVCENNSIFFYATDAVCIAYKKIPVSGCKDSFKIDIPVRALSLVNKYCEGNPIVIETDERFVKFNVGEICVISTLYSISKPFPAIEYFIPQNPQYRLRVGSKDFLADLNRVSIVNKDNERDKVMLRCSEEHCDLYANTENIGNATEPLKDAKFEGGTLNVAFASARIADAVRAVKSEEFEIVLAGENRNMCLRGDDPNNIQIISPFGYAAKIKTNR